MENKTPLKTIGRYQILEEIGSGGMGTVYKGLQPSLNRLVAIKVLPRTFSSDAELLQRFLRESQAIASLNHPHIIQIIDRGAEKGLYYFVMEYMDGPSLGVLLQKGRLPLAEALEIFSQVCQAVEFAHSRGVVHRDIKPSNVLLSQNRKVAKVADFGIAQIKLPGKEDSTLTQTYKSLGSLNYMSPEQRMDAARVDRRTDIYALGVVLYQMLSGSLPLGSFRLPSHFDRRIPPPLDRMVLRCLRSNPEERYPGIREMLQDAQIEKLKAVHLEGGVRNLLSSLKLAIRSLPRSFFEERKPGYIAGAAATVILLGLLAWLLTRRPEQTYGTAPDEFSRAASALQKKFEYAESLVQNGMAPQALVILKEIVDKYPRSSLADDAQIRIGQIKEASGSHQSALADYLKVLSDFHHGNRAPEAAFSVAMLYRHKLQDEKAAANAFQNVHQHYPASPYASQALYELGWMQGHPEENFLEKILGGQKKPAWQSSAQTLGQLLQEYPNCAEAPAALMELGRLYDPDHLNQPRQSNQYLEMLRARYPQTSFPLLYYLARNYEELGQKKLARDYYQQYLKGNPSGEEARKAREKLEELR